MSVFGDIKSKLFGGREQPIEPQGTAKTPARARKVVMYSTRFCPFCMRARALLQQKEVPFKDIAVDGKPQMREEMVQKSGRYTVPQIWIGDTHVGGCDELMQLERNGELDLMLEESPE